MMETAAIVAAIVIMGWHLSKTLSDIADRDAIANNRAKEEIGQKLNEILLQLDQIRYSVERSCEDDAA